MFYSTEIIEEVKKIKEQKGCVNVYVDETYSKPRYFPIFNEAQKKFILQIFRDGIWSRFDDSIIAVLETKCDDLSKIEKMYESEIDFIIDN